MTIEASAKRFQRNGVEQAFGELPREDLVELARVLADWIASAPSFTLYLYESRVRGDSRPDSDVDVVIDCGHHSAPDEMAWWISVNDSLFTSINGRLPGPLQLLVDNEPLRRAVMQSPVIHRDRQVVCVWTKPKPHPG
ncbi:MAG: hypothetical protein AB7F35_09170 [Acetobacteraceae bacterium]